MNKIWIWFLYELMNLFFCEFCMNLTFEMNEFDMNLNENLNMYYNDLKWIVWIEVTLN